MRGIGTRRRRACLSPDVVTPKAIPTLRPASNRVTLDNGQPVWLIISHVHDRGAPAGVERGARTSHEDLARLNHRPTMLIAYNLLHRLDLTQFRCLRERFAAATSGRALRATAACCWHASTVAAGADGRATAAPAKPPHPRRVCSSIRDGARCSADQATMRLLRSTTSWIDASRNCL